jgi:hypothetical protein
MRNNVMRTFQTNVKSAFSNLRNGNINKFTMQFISKKKSPNFTISEDARATKIERKGGSVVLSLTCLKGIRVNMKRLVSISSEVDLLFSNGFYYVATPECVAPDPYEC